MNHAGVTRQRPFNIAAIASVALLGTEGMSNEVTDMVSKQSWVKGGCCHLQTRIFHRDDISTTPVLVVVLHGDAPFHKPDYQYAFATKVAKDNRDVVAAAILRPGYTDPDGNKSEGERGESTGDNWNAKNTDAIADAIVRLKQSWNARKIVVAGHSGGAAIAANILGRHPERIDAALLVSCPCDTHQWRRHMLDRTGDSGFRGKIDTLSPVEHVEKLSDHANVIMVAGVLDPVSPLSLSKRYRDRAVGLGKKVKLVELEGKEHEIFLDPAVLAELRKLLA